MNRICINWEDQASFGDIIVSYLFSCRSKKMQKKILFQSIKEKRKLDNKTFSSNLYRLKNGGFIDFNKQNIFFNKKKLKSYNVFSNLKSRPTGETQIMVLFDIPESKRKIRN
ncbi:MAG: hypothetical protein NT068_00745 [Candidatus Nomurabacteria bacterium]|nr:hypothetical protein [Candidatus Nomurabacteria bacterium]